MSIYLFYSYHQSPMASIFMHWLVGMVYVFYFASFVILLREVRKKMSNSCIHLVYFEISRDFLFFFISGATTWSSLVLTKPEWSWFQSDPRDDTLVHRQTFEKVSGTYFLTIFVTIWDHLASFGTVWDPLGPFGTTFLVTIILIIIIYRTRATITRSWILSIHKAKGHST